MFSGVRHIILVIFLSFFPFFSFAGNCLDEISNKLKQGNAGSIASHFDGTVSLSLPGANATYSSTQAEMVLNDFFKKNGVKSMDIDRSGNNNSCKFAIGKLITSTGSYRVYMVVKDTKECTIKELRFEK